MSKNLIKKKRMLKQSYILISLSVSDACTFAQWIAIKFGCRVDFWFRDSHVSLEGEFFEWLKNWLITLTEKV